MNQLELLNEITEKSTLQQIQEYVETMVKIRGFDKESTQETVLLLLEEMGELAKAVRKSETNMSVDENRMYNYESVESEVADVFFVLTALCSRLDICLYSAFKEKEAKNCERKWRFDR